MDLLHPNFEVVGAERSLEVSGSNVESAFRQAIDKAEDYVMVYASFEGGGQVQLKIDCVGLTAQPSLNEGGVKVPNLTNFLVANALSAKGGSAANIVLLPGEEGSSGLALKLEMGGSDPFMKGLLFNLLRGLLQISKSWLKH